ncbi:uncharacterized protein LOC132064735 [Lycium ferocissimum]|uniref:uncharacterized protein LOC132064735 n=1 Tax=Lycium ferocissimum TaxID=112874 RepID=UPI002815615F|nr:uncharacterized protein LOC132064735 [Lycium ferocissimum]
MLLVALGSSCKVVVDHVAGAESSKTRSFRESSEKRPRHYGGYSSSSYWGGGQFSRPSVYGDGQSHGGSYSSPADRGGPSSSSASVYWPPAPRCCYVSGDSGYFMRDCPTSKSGSQQGSLFHTFRAPTPYGGRGCSSAKDGAQSGRSGSYPSRSGHQFSRGYSQTSRGGAQSGQSGHGGGLCYSFPGRPET